MSMASGQECSQSQSLAFETCFVLRMTSEKDQGLHLECLTEGFINLIEPKSFVFPSEEEA
jgi:hypothetical protein